MSIIGIDADPKDLEPLVKNSFTHTLRSMQSFLGSLSYYIWFIEDFTIHALVL